MDELSIDSLNHLLAESGYVSPAIKAEVEAKLTATISLVESRIADIHIVRPTVRYDLKGHTAGQAFKHGNYIRLNGYLLNKYKQDMLHNTLPHELAHIVTYQLWPNERDHHGPYWAFVMEQILELPATRCHQYATKAARTRTPKEWHYDCNCVGGHQVSNTIHKRIQQGKQYKCKRCGGTLHW
jgi:SprT protein